MRSNNFDAIDDVILWLDRDETGKPEQTLISFFDTYSPAESKFYLWEMFSGFFDGRKEGFHYDCDGSQMLFFYEQVMRLIESAYLIKEQQKKNKKKR